MPPSAPHVTITTPPIQCVATLGATKTAASPTPSCPLPSSAASRCQRHAHTLRRSTQQAVWERARQAATEHVRTRSSGCCLPRPPGARNTTNGRLQRRMLEAPRGRPRGSGPARRDLLSPAMASHAPSPLLLLSTPTVTLSLPTPARSLRCTPLESPRCPPRQPRPPRPRSFPTASAGPVARFTHALRQPVRPPSAAPPSPRPVGT
ncbi:hypothetical protein BDU57DRAFT_250826 [Ampelomyces quisqualis]|uniref:Uncharacterized protein n=1 Tax=Ampelomyces quisqualis TaxID=50730 RepID=A0A6A5QQ02_AMPQU|nr:hypothetical protein BDU57DRAFT_250826 [Ampelomyces quisqualis]